MFSHSPKHCEDRGFALIITLLLMVLITVIAVGLLSLSSISLRSSNAPKSQANANARLAVMMALGELQKETGTDQRITAPGAQKLALSDKSGRGNWTGVYDSWPASATTRPATPTFRRWLVSGDEAVIKDPLAPASTSPASAKEVILVAKDSQSDSVKAGLISTKTGAYGWWVGDQNTKARLGGSVNPAADARESVARLQATPRASHETFLGSAVTRESNALDRLVSIQTVSLLGAPLTPLFHDATTSSSGLVTNVRAGGFRTDLNILMEKPKPSSAESTPLYDVNGKPGINLGELWVAHNVWSEVNRNLTNPPPHADGGTFPSKTPFLESLGGIDAVVNDPFFPYRRLVKLNTTLIFSLKSENTAPPASPPDYKLFLVVDPIFTIWNPYNISIRIPTSTYSNFKTWCIPYDLNLNFKGGQGGDFTQYKAIQDYVSDNFLYVKIGNNRDMVIRPGEVQVIAQGFNKPIDEKGPAARTDGVLGWDFGSGFKYAIPYQNDALKRNGSDAITYSMTANSRTQGPYGLYISGHGIGPLDEAALYTHTGGHCINFYTSASGGTKIYANNFPKIFPPIPLNTSASKKISDMATTKWPIAVFTFGIRTEIDTGFDSSYAGTRFTGRAMLRSNPANIAHEMFNLEADAVRMVPLQVGMRRANSLNALKVECDTKGLGYYGAEYSSSSGVSYVVNTSVPLEPIHSIGALQQAIANGKPFPSSYSGETVDYLLPSINHPIANSFAPSILPPSQVKGRLSSGNDVADHSYLVNEALWDSYFHSSITPQTTSAQKNPSTAYGEQKTRLKAFLGAGGVPSKPLPNARMKPWTSNPDADLASIFPSNSPAATAKDRTGALLMVDGMFNVNSTSVNAWKAVLSGLRGEAVPVSPTPAVAASATLVSMKNSKDTPVPGLLNPAGMEIVSADIADPKTQPQWLGFRSLTETQIDELAKAIVKQVRLRGPFISLADFINRRPGSNIEMALSGPLQSALDDSSVSINTGYSGRSLSTPDATAQGFPFPAAEAGPKAVGSPGYVKQGDLLTSLGPLISVRGDTFIIRGYGEVRDTAGTKVLARSWCEAVVQRVPAYIVPTDAAYIKTPTMSVNSKFGRRFIVISFRYLNPNELSATS